MLAGVAPERGESGCEEDMCTGTCGGLKDGRLLECSRCTRDEHHGPTATGIMPAKQQKSTRRRSPRPDARLESGREPPSGAAAQPCESDRNVFV